MQNFKQNWQQELAQGFGDIASLCDYLNLPNNYQPHGDFPLRVPRGFAARMAKNNARDPLLLQVLPTSDELATTAGYSPDPVGDLDAVPVAGVIHKYQGRALLLATGGCAVHCRYCFRRNFPYADLQLSASKITAAVQYIATHTDISEVIISGGDPLLLGDDKLFSWLRRLANIQHIRRIRIHTRLPVVLPSRINADFCAQLGEIAKPVVVVIHANHANEMNLEVQTACTKLKTAALLLNQSVLLKGINDNAQQLCRLSEKLFDFGVLPYYLHLLDPVLGSQHFAVDLPQALAIMQQIKAQLPGYLTPKLVQEQKGAASKIVLA